MAVYEHTYQPYTGALTPERSRFLVIPRYAYRDLFKSRLITSIFIACFVYPLIAAILIYLHHNASAIAALRLDLDELVPINGSFFTTFMRVQASFGFFLTLFVAPSLMSRDLANNALPLYLCRPLTQAEYIFGKLSVVGILLSLITWIPGLLLYLFQSYLEGVGWFGRNLRIAFAIFVGSIVWIVMLALLSLALSAWVKWKLAASAALFGIYLVPSAIGQIINNIFDTNAGGIINLTRVVETVWTHLFYSDVRTDLSLWQAWAALAVVIVFCLLMLRRKVRAYEVVR